jgi:hypothetical protein
LFNEFLVSIYLYLLFSLTDFTGPIPLRDDIGWALMVVVVIAVGVNLIKAMWMDLLKVWAFVLRVKWSKRQAGEVVKMKPRLEEEKLETFFLDEQTNINHSILSLELPPN